jgi:hypothetical protein
MCLADRLTDYCTADADVNSTAPWKSREVDNFPIAAAPHNP